MKPPYRTTGNAGVLIRHKFRAALDLYGLAYTEHKAWTVSSFVITISDDLDEQHWRTVVRLFGADAE